MNNIEKLSNIENKYDLKQYKSWSYLRETYALELRKGGFANAKSAAKSKLSKLSLAYEAYFLGLRNWFRKYDYIIFDVSDNYKNFNCQYRNKLTCEITNNIGNDKCFHIQNFWEGSTNRSNDFIVSNSVILLISNTLSLLRWTKKAEDIYEDINAELNVNINFQKVYNILVLRKKIIKLILKLYMPKIIFTTCFSNRSEIIAAKELGILVVELQHGVINNTGYAGNNFINSAQPDYILVFGQNDKDFLMDTNYIKCSDNIIPVGSYMIDYAVKLKDDFLATYKRNFRKTISVSIQDPIVDETIEFIERSSKLLDDVLFIIIPRHKKISQPKAKNIIVLSSEATLSIIRFTDFHLSAWSACLLEAPSLGIPNIFWNYGNHSVEIHKKYIESREYNYLVNDENELLRLLEKEQVLVRKDLIIENEGYFTSGYSKNIANFTEMLFREVN